MSEKSPNIGLPRQIPAVAFYLGLAPVYYPLHRESHPYTTHHLRQALALFALLFPIFAFFGLAVLAISYTMIYHRAIFEEYHLETLTLTWTRRLFLCWLVCWVFAIALALLKSTSPMPLITRIARSTPLIRATTAAMLLLYATFAATLAFAAHATLLLRPAPEKQNAPVILLYDNVRNYPAPIMNLGFYRIALAARQRFGENTAIAQQITPEQLNHAVQNARFLFLGTHGQAQGLLISGKYLQPHDITVPKRNRKLQFVYLAGCDSGAQKQAWEQAFAPAQVITYERLTAVLEHIWWLWFDAPRIIKQLEDQPHRLNPAQKHKVQKPIPQETH